MLTSEAAAMRHFERSRKGYVRDEVEALMGLLKDKGVMVGAVAVTPDSMESPEEVAATLRAALAYVDAERLYPCTNCGMAPIPYGVALAKIQNLAAGAEMVRKEIEGR